MSRRVRCVIFPAILVALIVVAGVRVASVVRPPAGGPASLPPTARALDRLPLAFEANQGQTDPRVRFLARGRGYSLFLAQDESILVLQEPARGDRHAPPSGAGHQREKPSDRVVRMRLLGGDPRPALVGFDTLSGRSNYFVGNDPRRWRTGIAQYARVKYANPYPGIDLQFHGSQGLLEYDLVVAPGADPATVRIGFEGTGKVRLDPRGDLILPVGQGEIVQRAPVVYQDIDGRRSVIPGKYVLHGPAVVGLAVDRRLYDPSRSLVIDPVLVYSTYLGGSGYETGNAVAVDAAGNVYVTGQTSSAAFPAGGPTQPAFRDNADVYVAKLDVSGTRLVYTTFLGGGSSEEGYGVAVDSFGAAYVTGETWSTNFPTVHPFQPVPRGGTEAFVAKLDPTGSSLQYSSYLGGSSRDQARGIAVDAAGNAYLTGLTYSADFPTAQALQPARGGTQYDEDGFVTKVDPSGGTLLYSTYLGGTSTDESHGIAVDAAGHACVTGFTSSMDFPTVNPLEQNHPGGDAFVARLEPDGSVFLYSTWFGGTSFETGEGIAQDGDGSCYVTGWTTSIDFPTSNPMQAHSRDSAGVYKSTDGGMSWSSNGPDSTGVIALAVDRASPSTIYAVTQRQYATVLFKSTDGGGSWMATGSGLPSVPVTSLAIDPQNSQILYAASRGSGLFKSTDGGATWTAPDPSKPNAFVWVVATSLNPTPPVNLYAGIPAAIATSQDGGASWINAPVVDRSPFSIAADPLNPLIAYAGTTRNSPSGGGVYKTSDGGATWGSTAGPPISGPPLDVVALAVDPMNTSTIYAGTGGSTPSGVYKSITGGGGWVAVNNGLGYQDVRALAIDPFHAGVLYAATSMSGVFKTMDGAAHWSAVNHGLPGQIIASLAIDPRDPSTLYAGTVNPGSSNPREAFVTKLDPTGSDLVYSTYLGGSSTDWGRGIAVDSQGSAWVTGSTNSADFPTSHAIQPNFSGGSPDPTDGFIARLDPAGSSLVYSSYLGGNGSDTGSGVAVDSSGSVTVVGTTNSPNLPAVRSWQPVMGGSYDAFVTRIADDAPSPQPGPYPGDGRVEESDPSVRSSGTWYTNGSTVHSGGSAIFASGRYSRVALNFNGTGVSWIGNSDEWSGIASVYLDGLQAGTVDTYASPARYQAVLFTAEGLADGAHTLVVEVTGTHGAQSTESWVWVDAFDVIGTEPQPTPTPTPTPSPTPAPSAGRIEDSDAALTYGGDWYTNASAGHSGGTAALSPDPDATVRLTFDGTGIRWIGCRDEWSGIASVLLDGAPRETVDTYASPGQCQAVLFSAEGLTPGTHTLVVEVTGLKNQASGGPWIWIDAFDVLNDSVQSSGSP